ESDRALAAAGLAWRGTEQRDEPFNISGRAQCNKFLKDAVDALWNQIRASLGAIERKALVYQCLRNHEAVHLDRDVWRRTSRALTAVYKDRDDIIASAHRHDAGFNLATLASR